MGRRHQSWPPAIAFDEASRRGVELTALHAWSDIEFFELPGYDWVAVQAEAERNLAECLAGWQERFPDVGCSGLSFATDQLGS